jgi:hypothetical protein
LSKGITDFIWLEALHLCKAGQQEQDIYIAFVEKEVVADIGDAVQGKIPATTG